MSQVYLHTFEVASFDVEPSFFIFDSSFSASFPDDEAGDVKTTPWRSFSVSAVCLSTAELSFRPKASGLGTFGILSIISRTNASGSSAPGT